jgi:hypothetical protein
VLRRANTRANPGEILKYQFHDVIWS